MEHRRIMKLMLNQIYIVIVHLVRFINNVNLTEIQIGAPGVTFRTCPLIY